MGHKRGNTAKVIRAVLRCRDITTASESTSTEAPPEYTSIGLVTEPLLTVDASFHTCDAQCISPRLEEPKQIHDMSSKLSFQRGVKGLQQQSVKENAEQKEREGTLKQLRLLKHELCKAQVPSLAHVSKFFECLQVPVMRTYVHKVLHQSYFTLQLLLASSATSSQGSP